MTGLSPLQWFTRKGNLSLSFILLLTASLALADPPSDGQKPYDYTPNRSSVPPSESVLIDGSWRDYIRFIYNRGEGKTHFLSELQDLIDPTRIRKMEGFRSPGATRVSLMSYEIRSIEVFQAIETLLADKFRVRVVTDPATFMDVEIPSREEWKSWNSSQRAYFLSNYDRDHDGKYSTDDYEAMKERRFVANEIWKKLEGLQKKYGERLELIHSPFQVVSNDPKAPYPKLTHFKRSAIQFATKKGEWQTVEEMVSSANLTNSCLDCSISGSADNKAKYLSGTGDFARARGTEGHIQFGAILGQEATAGGKAKPEDAKAMLEALTGPAEEWIKLYKEGKHFDSAKVQKELFPRVVFEDAKRGYTTSIQAFFSEGIQRCQKAQAHRPHPGHSKHHQPSGYRPQNLLRSAVYLRA